MNRNFPLPFQIRQLTQLEIAINPPFMFSKRVRSALALKTYVTTYRSIVLIFVRQTNTEIFLALMTIRKKHTHSVGMTHFTSETASIAKLKQILDEPELIIRNATLQLRSFEAILDTVDGRSVILLESCLNVSFADVCSNCRYINIPLEWPLQAEDSLIFPTLRSVEFSHSRTTSCPQMGNSRFRCCFRHAESSLVRTTSI